MRLTTAALLSVLTSPATAAEVVFPVSIPQECVELANREGVPTTIQNKYQAAKAKLKLYRLSGRDPLVHECRNAVERQKAAMRAAAKSPASTSAPQYPSPDLSSNRP